LHGHLYYCNHIVIGFVCALLSPKLLLLLLQALAAMVKLELPHINLLTKMDLAEDRTAVQEFLIPDPQLLMDRWADV
jgi:putative ribosome biogenesis GTPase RsgA